ncbi:MAG: MFS transporter [Rhodospirillaceae bacterium]|nr:MAG: MFS transporter [Rhodospirillaceae bacterium]
MSFKKTPLGTPPTHATECHSDEYFSTTIPTRLDRLPWDQFHVLVIVALGVTWILDGLEVTLVGSLAGAIQTSPSLAMSASRIGLAASAYIFGAVTGALVFGRLADRFGRKRLFTITVGVYAVATVLTGLSWNFHSFAFFRMVTGAGIGGEYAAINSAIQEFIPARWRGRVDLAVNGSFWLGAALGGLGAVVVLDPTLFAADVGWRLAFGIGGLLGAVVIFLRRLLPESPRWLMAHGRVEDAEQIVAGIENRIVRRRGIALSAQNLGATRFRRLHRLTFADIAHTLFIRYRRRAVLGVVLMATQAFCYNAVFFTYALILTRFYGVPSERVGWFILPFAFGNFLGPLMLGPFFDTIGRRPMIAATYALAGLLLAATGELFSLGMLTAVTQTVAWSVVFFFASAGASAAYLTVGESFPLEMRASAIAIFYAIGTAMGGVVGPALFGALIDRGSRPEILWGYLLGGGLMMFAAAVEVFLGFAAERRPLEQVAAPLSAAEDITPTFPRRP